MTTEQVISNTFETMESLGKEHTSEVAYQLLDRMTEDGSVDDLGKKHMVMFIAIAKFIEDVK